MTTTINEGRVLAALHARSSPLSLQGFVEVTELEVKPLRKALSALTCSGLIEARDSVEEPVWALTARARRWLETSLGRAVLDVPPVPPANGYVAPRS
ncbi:hypothetical protein [Nocardia sp. NPDC050435]|uniref:hypothetical protein n=1 Tax=Nocardia sp. NPDC050435 TaxID=3155040 RepID=UPI0033E50926